MLSPTAFPSRGYRQSELWGRGGVFTPRTWETKPCKDPTSEPRSFSSTTPGSVSSTLPPGFNHRSVSPAGTLPCGAAPARRWAPVGATWTPLVGLCESACLMLRAQIGTVLFVPSFIQSAGQRQTFSGCRRENDSFDPGLWRRGGAPWSDFPTGTVSWAACRSLEGGGCG